MFDRIYEAEAKVKEMEKELEEAIKHAEEVAESQQRLGDSYDYWDGDGEKDKADECFECAKEHRQLAEWLKELKQLREQTRWIPVSEGLPEERYAVLVWCPERKNTYCAYLENGQWWIFGAYFEKVKLEVTAWMHRDIPEPYKAESEEV